MMHQTTPDENGWYWIEDADEFWKMAYLDIERDDPKVVIHYPDGSNQVVDIPSEHEPLRWIGPLKCPGGDFHSHIIEHDVPTHEKAKALGRAIVSITIDMTPCEHSQGTITTVGFFGPDEAIERSLQAFRETKGGVRETESKNPETTL